MGVERVNEKRKSEHGRPGLSVGIVADILRVPTVF